MSSFCIGSAQFGMDYGISNNSGIPKQHVVSDIIKYAYSNNVNYLDTAQSYGKSEMLIGKISKEVNFIKKMKVVSKLDPSYSQSNRKQILESLVLSINRLNIKKLYGFLAHNFDTIRNKEFFYAMDEAKDLNLLSKVGVSIYTPEEALIAITNKNIDIIQMPLNIIDRRWHDLNIFEIAKEKQIQLFFRSIFLQGLLLITPEKLKTLDMEWAFSHLSSFRKSVYETGLSVHELSFGLLPQVSKSSVIIIGIDNLSQLKTNLDYASNLNQFSISANDWWGSLPKFPDRLLNPTLWEKK